MKVKANKNSHLGTIDHDSVFLNWKCHPSNRHFII